MSIIFILYQLIIQVRIEVHGGGGGGFWPKTIKNKQNRKWAVVQAWLEILKS